MSACAWCNRRCVASSLDEDGDPCCDNCARLAGLEYVGDAARRLRCSAALLGRAAKSAGHVSRRLAPATWDRVGRHLSN